MRNLIFICCSTLILNLGKAQNAASLKLAPADKELSSCYNLSVRNENTRSINLAGQNYRMFYDAKVVEFIPEVSSRLDPRSYAEFDVENRIKGGIGFISISTDAVQKNEHSRILEPQKWVEIVQLCFSEIAHGDAALLLANPKATANIATVDIVISEWLSEGQQQVLTIHEYISEGPKINTQQEGEPSFSVFPNPASEYTIYRFDALDNKEQIVVTDALGREMSRQEIIPGAEQGVVKLANMPRGRYFVTSREHGTIQLVITN